MHTNAIVVPCWANKCGIDGRVVHLNTGPPVAFRERALWQSFNLQRGRPPPRRRSTFGKGEGVAEASVRGLSAKSLFIRKCNLLSPIVRTKGAAMPSQRWALCHLSTVRARAASASATIPSPDSPHAPPCADTLVAHAGNAVHYGKERQTRRQDNWLRRPCDSSWGWLLRAMRGWSVYVCVCVGRGKCHSTIKSTSAICWVMLVPPPHSLSSSVSHCCIMPVCLLFCLFYGALSSDDGNFVISCCHHW